MPRRTPGSSSGPLRRGRNGCETPLPMVGSTPLKHFVPQSEMATGIAQPPDRRPPTGTRKAVTRHRRILQISGVPAKIATVRAEKTAATMGYQVLEMMAAPLGNHRDRAGQHRFDNRPAPTLPHPRPEL